MTIFKRINSNSAIYLNTHPIISIVILNVLLFLFLLFTLEIGLRVFAPIGVTNSGYLHSPNGLKYGWGFKPYDVVRIEDPDTGEISYDRVNNHGWRDRDRTYVNKKNAFRVVVLGDSEVFGYIVPKRKTFTFLLEERFKNEVKNVEIINIAYAGWGTSQQLEALEKEALLYKPNLIIVNFVGNDLSDNVTPLENSKFGNRIPFFHQVSVTGKLTRANNPKFIAERKAITRNYLLSKFEILKRLWLFRLGLKHAKRKKHIIASGQINLMHLIFGKTLPKKFKLKLEKIRGLEKGLEMTKSELIDFLNPFQLSKDIRKVIIRISENRTFLREFNGPGHYNKIKLSNKNQEKLATSKETRLWILYTKLMLKMKSILANKGIPLAITSDYGSKRYDWACYWYFASGEESEKKNFLKINHRLKSFAEKNGIMFIQPPSDDQRARNDPHLNELGHQAKAENLYNYLIKSFGKNILSK